jgi:ribonuclease P protein component
VPAWPPAAGVSSSSGAAPRAASVWQSRASTVKATPTNRGARRFRPHQRLATEAEFDQVFREGRRSADRIFTVLYRPNGTGHARLGFALARQRVKLAVHRNRLRRLVRESFRAADPPLPGVDIVVLARDAAAGTTNPDVAASIARHWDKLRAQFVRPTGSADPP